MNKIKNFFIKILPSKRKLIQLYAALLFNANLKGYITGDISTSKVKSTCLPGMNCYSCPGAIMACPLGSLQNALAASNTSSLRYILGIIMLYGIIFGRTICGWLCPGGLLQELLYKIKTPKLRKNRFTRILSYFKYVLLVVLVCIIPFMFGNTALKSVPAFCKFICPIGTFEGGVFLLSNAKNSNFFAMLTGLFTWKFALLIIFIVASIFIYRFFCRFFCPLGAIYGIFNKLAILGIKVDKSKCNHCGSCVSHCKMDVKVVGDHECIMCGECKDVCKTGAIDFASIRTLIKKEKEEQGIIVEEKTTETTTVVEEKKASNKSLFEKIWKIAVPVVMLLFLLGVFLYYNIDWSGSKKVAINEEMPAVSLTLYDNDSYCLSDSDNVKVFYFYDNYNKEEIDSLYSLDTTKIDILVISSYANKEVNRRQLEMKENVYYGYDTDSQELLSYFTDTVKYPYYGWLDKENIVKYSSAKAFEDSDYTSITGASMGVKIGKEVGNFCIGGNITIATRNKELSTFNVNNNLGKITVINFWATWCGPCVNELPYFNEINNKYGDLVDVVVVHDGATFDSDEFYEFINKSKNNINQYTFNWAYDDEAQTYFRALGGTDGFPMTIIVDQNGFIVYNQVGSVTVESLEKIIAPLIK